MQSQLEVSFPDVALKNDDLHRKGFITAYPSSRYWRSTYRPIQDSDDKLNLYIHIPYCIQRCAYCFFKITELSRDNHSEINKYVDYLCKEIAMAAAQFGWANRPVDTLYFGGGTPSLLKESHMEKIMSALHENFNMCLTEFVFEVEPITYTDSKSKLLSKFGITRMSFGIQSFCDDVVRKTGRKDTEKENVDAILKALDTGVTVNIDLLSGLEGETMESWKYSVDRAISLNVHAITVYKMELYKNSRYFTAIKNDQLVLPDDEEELAFMDYALDQLAAKDYKNSTYFTFTKQGKYPQKHIANRWKGYDTYGFGVSAYSSMSSHYSQNTSITSRYFESIENGRLPIERGVKLTSVQSIGRDIVLGMKLAYLDCEWFENKHGINLLAKKNKITSLLLDQDFITVEGRIIKLSRKGIMYGDFVGKSMSRYVLENCF